MQFLIGLLGILTAIGIWSWRMRMARDGAREAVDLARTAAHLPRRLAFKYRSGRNGLDLIDDPREAPLPVHHGRSP
jgi:type II secretory pathway pseudopilin PulG